MSEESELNRLADEILREGGEEDHSGRTVVALAKALQSGFDSLASIGEDLRDLRKASDDDDDEEEDEDDDYEDDEDDDDEDDEDDEDDDYDDDEDEDDDEDDEDDEDDDDEDDEDDDYDDDEDEDDDEDDEDVGYKTMSKGGRYDDDDDDGGSSDATEYIQALQKAQLVQARLLASLVKEMAELRDQNVHLGEMMLTVGRVVDHGTTEMAKAMQQAPIRETTAPPLQSRIPASPGVRPELFAVDGDNDKVSVADVWRARANGVIGREAEQLFKAAGRFSEDEQEHRSLLAKVLAAKEAK